MRCAEIKYEHLLRRCDSLKVCCLDDLILTYTHIENENSLLTNEKSVRITTIPSCGLPTDTLTAIVELGR